MDAGWEIDRCVVCLRELDPNDPLTELSRAHVIPASIGGKLYARFLCKRCNSRSGTAIEADLVNDPTVRHLVEQLADQMPELATKLRSGKTLIARTTDGGLVRARAASDEFRIFYTEQPDGSKTADPIDVRRELEGRLCQSDADDDAVAAALARYDAAEEGVPTEIDGFTITKGSVRSFTLPYDEDAVKPTLPLGIAYLYLACCVDGLIFEDAFEPMRRVLRGESDDEGPWHVEWLMTRKPKPWHGLALTQVTPHVVVLVRLFGDYVWKVHFDKVALKSDPSVAYRIDLTTGSELLNGEPVAP